MDTVLKFWPVIAWILSTVGAYCFGLYQARRQRQPVLREFVYAVIEDIRYVIWTYHKLTDKDISLRFEGNISRLKHVQPLLQGLDVQPLILALDSGDPEFIMIAYSDLSASIAEYRDPWTIDFLHP